MARASAPRLPCGVLAFRPRRRSGSRQSCAWAPGRSCLSSPRKPQWNWPFRTQPWARPCRSRSLSEVGG
eukprot:7916242-Pyramimonas_sp.AAC.1